MFLELIQVAVVDITSWPGWNERGFIARTGCTCQPLLPSLVNGDDRRRKSNVWHLIAAVVKDKSPSAVKSVAPCLVSLASVYGRKIMQE